MRTTVEINDKLYADAKKLTGIKTKKELVNASLKEMIRKKRLEKAAKHAGKVKLDITVDELVRQRQQR